MEIKYKRNSSQKKKRNKLKKGKALLLEKLRRRQTL